MKKLRFTLFFTLALTTALAQGVRSEIEAINHVLLSSKEVSFSMSYQLYSDSLSSKVLEVHTIQYARSGNNTFYADDQSKNVVNQGVSVVVDENRKAIIRSKGEATSLSDRFNNGFPLLFDSVFNKIPTSFIAEGKLKGIVFHYPKKFGISNFIMWYNPKNHHIDRCVMHYLQPIPLEKGETGPKPRLEIHFNNLKEKVEDQAIFQMDQFMKPTDQGYQLTKTYSNYQFVDLLKTQGHE